MIHIFEQVCRALRENNHITQQSIEELLFATITSKPMARDTSFQGLL